MLRDGYVNGLTIFRRDGAHSGNDKGLDARRVPEDVPAGLDLFDSSIANPPQCLLGRKTLYITIDSVTARGVVAP